MNIQTHSVHNSLQERDVKDCAVVVVDVLRASSTIICALMNKAEKIIPTLEVNEAVGMARAMGREISLLAGEAGGQKYPDFDLDNSPSDLRSRSLKGKTVVLKTSNGTSALHRVRNCPYVFIGGMLNKSAVAGAIKTLGRDLMIICAGTSGHTSIDDLYCAGAIIGAIKATVKNVTLCDTSLLCDYIYSQDSGYDLVKQCSHYRLLETLGRKGDIDLSFTEDVTDIVPIYLEGKIIQYKK